MSIVKKLAITAIIGTPITFLVYRAGCLGALYERFPDVDRKIARKAHDKLLLDTIKGKYKDLELTDDLCDAIFRSHVFKLTNR